MEKKITAAQARAQLNSDLEELKKAQEGLKASCQKPWKTNGYQRFSRLISR